MDTQMVTPSQLHRSLERASFASVEDRREILDEVLASNNLAVIRRIPDLFMPFQGVEINTIHVWAVDLVMSPDSDVSDKDFAFHLLVNCRVPSEIIIELLERNGTYSRTALEHIQQTLTGDRTKFDQYLRQVADELLKSSKVPQRDRGRHTYMTAARTPDDWRTLAKKFTDQFSDLRQRVIERFLTECPDQAAAEAFCKVVVDECLGIIDQAQTGHEAARQMHWIISCGERLNWKWNLREIVETFPTDFGRTLPISVRYRLPSNRHLKREPELDYDPFSW